MIRGRFRLQVFLLTGLLFLSAGVISRAQVPGSGGNGAPQVGFEIGDMAPDIAGEDLDGVKFKLSDYRGRVVVLDFWGHW